MLNFGLGCSSPLPFRADFLVLRFCKSLDIIITIICVWYEWAFHVFFFSLFFCLSSVNTSHLWILPQHLYLHFIHFIAHIFLLNGLIEINNNYIFPSISITLLFLKRILPYDLGKDSFQWKQFHRKCQNHLFKVMMQLRLKWILWLYHPQNKVTQM